MTSRSISPAALARAVVELLRARLFLARVDAGEVASLAAFDSAAPETSQDQLPRDVERVAYLIPRVAARLPWRTDCLVQALAARRWLASLGHDSLLHLGSRKEGDRLAAHAWLTWRGHVITGGSVDSYAPFVRATSGSQ